ncbi:hypothetical protein J1N35_045092 [Gossypium stocksii]|uniref:F-box domain-containing protein n=1 Tax=Gossypium stocksii TaxID=47602 RepID=A0A9D3ZH23_9ROSI|nr:hypothetical protein J1N35_045092 [Gossypium stocksii]
MNPKLMISSAEKIGNNQDLLAQILLRLPAKSLIKFKCVSKQWLSLISNPQFCLSHTRHQGDEGFLHPTALLLKVQYIVSPEFDVVPLKHFSQVPFFHYISTSGLDILQSCNGLFVCEALDDDLNVSGYFICNPTTKQFKKLSFLQNPIKDCEFYVSLAFDPLQSPHYKIIVVREVLENSFIFVLDIYASESDSWKVATTIFETKEEACMAFENAVFCNGKLHWNSYGNQSFYLDVEKERLQMMPMPTTLRENHRLEIYRYFDECGGRLHLAVTYHAFIDLDLHVHQMASDYSHWFLKHRLNVGDAMKVFPELNLGCHPFSSGFSGVSFVGSERKEEAKVVIWADGKIICYDFNDGAWKMMHDPGPGLKIGTPIEHYNHLHEQRFIPYKYFESVYVFEDM